MEESDIFKIKDDDSDDAATKKGLISLPVQIRRANTVKNSNLHLKLTFLAFIIHRKTDFSYLIFSLCRYTRYSYYVLSPSCKTLVLFRRVAKCQLYCIV